MIQERIVERLLHGGNETLKIVKAFAEHDFYAQRLIGTFRVTE